MHFLERKKFSSLVILILFILCRLFLSDKNTIKKKISNPTFKILKKKFIGLSESVKTENASKSRHIWVSHKFNILSGCLTHEKKKHLSDFQKRIIHFMNNTYLFVLLFALTPFTIYGKNRAGLPDPLEDYYLYEKSLQQTKFLGIVSKETILAKLFNFDSVIKNNHYSLYRSSLLGNYGLKLLKSHLDKNQQPFPKTIIYMNKYGYNGYLPPILGDFAIEEFQGQQEYGYRLYHSFDYTQSTYLDGHNPYQPAEDIDGQTSYLFDSEAEQLFGYREHPAFDGDDNNFVSILEIILNPDNHPVLFHCFGGRHRTGMVAMAVRYLQGGNWIDGDKKTVYLTNGAIELNPAQYEYYEHNKTMVRIENFSFIEKFKDDPRFLDLKERYKKFLE
jgi:hypothetical protein